MKRVDKKVVIVTGGASGLGKITAQYFVTEGATVIITDMQKVSGTETAEALGCDFFQHDVANEKQWEDLIDFTKEKYGALHVLVNNAGILGPMDKASPESTELTDWQKIFAVNVEGVFLGCRAGIPLLRQSGGGSIINISSIASLVASPYASAYGASKAAVRHLTKSIAQHCAETHSNIRCNSIHPGIVRTAMTDRHYETTAKERGVTKEQVIREVKSSIPQGDFIAPEAVASAVLYLASDEARFITGTKLIVDGGLVNCETFVPTLD